MNKILSFKNFNERTGENAAVVINKAASLEKFAAPLLPKVAQFMDALDPDPAKIYVLVNALGSHEYWGPNINGDAFPDDVLGYEGPEDYGYKTFERYAFPYRHHKNKDPRNSFGRVDLAAWNPKMHRVELIVSLDRHLAEVNGGLDVIEKIESGQFPEVSMGCKVPFDVCSICNPDWRELINVPARELLERHAAKPIPGLARTRADYCEHARTMMGKTLPNGGRVYVVNLHPRFFDISFVFIGADKTARVMKKLANVGKECSATGYGCFGCSACARGGEPPSAYIADLYGHDLDLDYELEKIAEAKREPEPTSFFFQKPIKKEGKLSKAANIDKKLATNLDSPTVALLSNSEKDIPDHTLDRLSKYPLGNTLSTLAGLGIPLKPREFQKIIVIKMGVTDPELDDCVFAPAECANDSIQMGPEMFSPAIARLLTSLISERSAYLPPLRRRMSRLRVRPHMDKKPSIKEASTPLLDKIGAAYLGYRQRLPEVMESCVLTIEKDASILSEIIGSDLDDSLSGRTKTAGAGKWVLPIIGTAPIVYMLSAHLREEEQRGKELGMAGKLVASSPGVSTALVSGGLVAAYPTAKPYLKKVLEIASKKGKEYASRM